MLVKSGLVLAATVAAVVGMTNLKDYVVLVRLGHNGTPTAESGAWDQKNKVVPPLPETRPVGFLLCL